LLRGVLFEASPAIAILGSLCAGGFLSRDSRALQFADMQMPDALPVVASALVLLAAAGNRGRSTGRAGSEVDVMTALRAGLTTLAC